LRIAITGATGLLGRNLLFEIIKQNLRNLDELELFILGRNARDMNIAGRVRQIAMDDGLSYLSLDKKKAESIERFVKDGIKCIYMNLTEDKLGIDSENLRSLAADKIDIFFHLAALTDLRHTPQIIKALDRTNIYGTKQILQLASSLKIGEFCYMGTAYSCGNMRGKIKPESIDPEQKFRNPYEATKMEAEFLVKKFSKKTKTRCRYFRPSVTCGRLIEAPLGHVSKFDVFYGWAGFFLQLKMKKLQAAKDKYATPVELDMRIHYNLKSGLNIVPADYAAKVVYQVCAQEDPGESYHLVNNRETPHSVYIPLMLETVNIRGVRQADKMPDNINRLEQLYYKTAGSVFTPYITGEPMLFETGNLTSVLDNAGMSCPAVDERSFPVLMEYARKYDFGLKARNNENKN